jgi:predicted nucleotide-binding protein
MVQKKRQAEKEEVIPPSVNAETGIGLLKKLVGKADELRTRPEIKESDIQPWKTLARDYLVRAFGSESPNVNAVLYASGDGGLSMGMGDHEFETYLRSGLTNKIKILESCIEQLETDITLNAQTIESEEVAQEFVLPPVSKKIFIVHGHNHGLKETVARFLEKLDLDPIILHEKPSAGRTIIEKFSDYAGVQFAVVLLTGDDEGKLRLSADPTRLRARQNVILELGYFLGKLGRARVCVLYEKDVDIPSDYQGVLFIQLDSGDHWRFELVKELRAAGYNVDANRIFSAD